MDLWSRLNTVLNDREWFSWEVTTGGASEAKIATAYKTLLAANVRVRYFPDNVQFMIAPHGQSCWQSPDALSSSTIQVNILITIEITSQKHMQISAFKHFFKSLCDYVQHVALQYAVINWIWVWSDKIKYMKMYLNPLNVESIYSTKCFFPCRVFGASSRHI